ncbi:MAG: hypothetical protein E7233_03820 [Lachnospiraceae bacterium]|nr:hypothetical protein [Lachnospiraceae bacterium]
MINYLEFGGIKSSDYGIYISGEGVFNAPARDVKIVNIPGRNGDYILDQGRYKNISVIYPAFNQELSKEEFIEAIDLFRNAIGSRKGYQRLTDSFHPDEYRLASLIDGLEVKPVLYNDRASRINLIFNCKPQRFLISGDEAISIDNNSVLTNPTLFESRPLIKFNANADGEILIGNQRIQVLNTLIGLIDLRIRSREVVSDNYFPCEIVTILNTNGYNNGDPIILKGAAANFALRWTSTQIRGAIAENEDGLSAKIQHSSTQINLEIKSLDAVFAAGTAETVTKTVDITVSYANNQTETRTYAVQFVYNGTDTIIVRWLVPAFTYLADRARYSRSNFSATADSSINTLTGDVYIDLDIGEAYKLYDGNVVALNNFINLGGELPVIYPGDNTISYDNTISNVEITPRWWKV